MNIILLEYIIFFEISFLCPPDEMTEPVSVDTPMSE
jgi:hypothetical protein